MLPGAEREGQERKGVSGVEVEVEWVDIAWPGL